jgi:hypothetical protein
MYTIADLPQLRTDLADYMVAYKDVLSGNKKTKYVIGTGSSRREYAYQDINEQVLVGEIQRLQDIIASLSPVEPNFRTAHHRIAWSKR